MVLMVESASLHVTMLKAASVNSDIANASRHCMDSPAIRKALSEAPGGAFAEQLAKLTHVAADLHPSHAQHVGSGNLPGRGPGGRGLG